MNGNKKIFQIPTTDFSFKRIFGTESNKRFLIHFLNCFVSRYTGRIDDITYLPTEQYGLSKSERKVIFDILCVDNEKRNFIIEMQCARQPEYIERSIFYLSRAISSSMESGSRNYHIMPTYSVNILDFELPEYAKSGECFKAIFFHDQKKQLMTRKVGIFYLNLCNFAAKQSDVTGEMRTWLTLLKNMPQMDESDYTDYDGVFRELLDECRISKLDTMEKENYRKSVLEYEDVQEAIAYAKELAAKESYSSGLQKGRMEGIKEGIEKGIEEGIEKGIEKGRQEALIQTARNLLDLGIPVADVAKATGLDEELLRSMQS